MTFIEGISVEDYKEESPMDVVCWSAPGIKCNNKLQVATDKEVARKTLHRILDETKSRFYKIGITCNPQSRAYGHEGVEVDRREEGDMIYITVQKGLWSMHVIYQASNADDIRRAEAEFIKDTLNKYGGAFREDWKEDQNIFPFNVRSGGGGSLSTRGPYFLYVLRSRV